MLRPTLRRARHFRWGREVLLVGLAYLLYAMARTLSASRTLDAFENAEILVRAERALGIFVELNVQVAILGWHGIVDFLSLWYFWGHFPLMIAFALWAFVRHRGDYLWARNAIFAAGAISLAIYVAFPVAPPRLFPGAGFVDTLQGVFALHYADVSMVNQFAAVPSMHQGYALIVGVGLYRVIGGRRGRAIMLTLPALMFVSIVATGNHWFLDAVVGAAVAFVGMGVASHVEQRGLPLPGVARGLLSVKPPTPGRPPERTVVVPPVRGSG
jgi:hypothetical protein